MPTIWLAYRWYFGTNVQTGTVHLEQPHVADRWGPARARCGLEMPGWAQGRWLVIFPEQPEGHLCARCARWAP